MIPVLHGVWAAAGGLVGDFEHIETQTVGAGGASSVTLSSIPGTYKHLQLRYLSLTGSWTVLQFNNDTGANYKGHELRGNGTSANSYVSAETTNILVNIGALSTTYATVGVTDILDYQSTSKYKTMRSLGGGDANGSGIVDLVSGLWMSTSAVTSIKILPYPNETLAQHSTYSLYGVK